MHSGNTARSKDFILVSNEYSVAIPGVEADMTLSLNAMSNEYFQEYSQRLSEHLTEALTSSGFLNGKILSSPDIDAKWDELAADYFGDSIKEFNSYPEFVLAGACYLGMAVAKLWDKDWSSASVMGYASFTGPQGFDYMDEYIVPEVLEADEASAKAINEAARLCSVCALSYLRHEAVEPQSVVAYKLVLASIAVMFRMGESLELRRLGYNFEKL